MRQETKGSFDRRVAVVRDLIHGFGLESTEILPVRWDENQNFPYNNFIFKVTLSSPALKDHFPGSVRQPCADPAPAEGTSALIVRLSNPRALGLNNANRVENEVAAMRLSRTALSQLGAKYASLVPAVYAWKAAEKPMPVDETGFGWTVMEYLKGSSLNTAFKSLEISEKKRVISEIAAIFSTLQGIQLPPGVDQYGGFTIDDHGNIISGQETIQAIPGGPWREYHEYWKHQLLCQLEETDHNDTIEGWRHGAYQIRERIETFIHTTLPDVMHKAGVDSSLLSFVHTDFTMSNMLYDHEKQCISGLVDFDWAAATHPGNEFFTSLHDVYGTSSGIAQVSSKLQQAILEGDFSAGVDADESEHEAWELAKTWHEAVKKHNGSRLSDIGGMETLLKLNAFTDMINPYHLNYSVKGQTAEQNAEARAETEKALHDILSEWGV